jgi:hypothetical protein
MVEIFYSSNLPWYAVLPHAIPTPPPLICAPVEYLQIDGRVGTVRPHFLDCTPSKTSALLHGI